MRVGSVEDWEMKEVEDKEEFEAEEEKALLNHGEDELAVLRYKGEVRKMRWAGGQGQGDGGAVL